MRDIDLASMVPARCLDLPAFEKRMFTRVRWQAMAWDTGWNRILQFGLYQKGPDVSEVGSTWIENLIEMRALRPFSETEVRALGGREAFFPAAWPGHWARDEQRLVSIPWSLDTRLICYRRDLLARARVEESAAFATPEAVYDTLCRLRAAGIPYPLGLPTGGISIHNMASWVWGRGGWFRSADSRRIRLVEPESRRGMLDYFRLHTFVDPDTRGENYLQTDARYYAGQAAVLFSGQWAMKMIKDQVDQVAPAVAQNTGYARLPGIPWVGSAHLVIWRFSLQPVEAVHLVTHLTRPEVLECIFQAGGNFPARLEVLQSPPFSEDPDLRLVAGCLQDGRPFTMGRMWAGVEMRLNALHDQLWADLLDNPPCDLEREIERRVTEAAARLEKTILAKC